MAILESLVTDVRALTGFDRVMIYRFDPQWNGEVIAEDRRDDLEPVLGLHYPAADIPAQARALYEHNWLRLIPDDRFVLRRIVASRMLVSPTTGRHLFPWRRLGTLLGADHKAVQRWHGQGVALLVRALAGKG